MPQEKAPFAYLWDGVFRLAARLTEVVCALAARQARLRQGRACLAAEWEAIATRRPSYRPDEPHTVSLLTSCLGCWCPSPATAAPKASATSRSSFARPRMANYDTKGQVSKAFHEFYSETLCWAKVWQAKREADE